VSHRASACAAKACRYLLYDLYKAWGSMGEIAVSQARDNLAEGIETTQRSGEPIVLTRHGRPVAVVLEYGGSRAVRSLADLQRRDQQRIGAAIDLLAENPRPPTVLRSQVKLGSTGCVYGLSASCMRCSIGC